MHGRLHALLLGDELDEFRTVLEEGGLVQRLGHNVRDHLVGWSPHRIDLVVEEEFARVVDPYFVLLVPRALRRTRVADGGDGSFVVNEKLDG